jgi:hypothetical protein
VGSIPTTRSKLEAAKAHIAQSAEHFLGKEEVTGSIPVVGSKLKKMREFISQANF